MSALGLRVWIGSAVLTLTAAPVTGQEGFQQAWRLVGEARFVEALEAARAEADPLWRDRALLFVWHHAGDLRGALAAGRSGLERSPDDAWLLEQSAFVAISLQEARLATEFARRLERVAETANLESQEQERYRRRATELGAEAAQLQLAAEARAGALRAARRTVAAVLGLGLVLFGLLALVPVPRAGIARPRRAARGGSQPS